MKFVHQGYLILVIFVGLASCGLMPPASAQDKSALPPGFRVYGIFHESAKDVEPGNRVEVILTNKLKAGKTETEVLVRNVRVLAGDPNWIRGKEPSGPYALLAISVDDCHRVSEAGK